MQLKPIGFVRSCFIDKFGTPRQSLLVEESPGFIDMLPEVQPEESMLGLDQFSHFWVIYGFHLNTDKVFHAKISPPKLEAQRMGIFASRSPHRPNPLGLSLVRLTHMSGRQLHYCGGDMVDGSPVYDIKPYLPRNEAISGASMGWAEPLEMRKYKVCLSESVKERITEIKIPGVEDVSRWLEDLLCHDPRPLVYKKRDRQEGAQRFRYAIRLYDYDFYFVYQDDLMITIVDFRSY